MITVSVCQRQPAWEEVLTQFGAWDFGHGYEFHAVSEQNGEGSPVLFVANNEEREPVMIWPGLLRPITNTSMSDMTSTYGYGGPVLKDFRRSKECFDAVFERMREMQIVDVFSRMHPVLGVGFEKTDSDCVESGSVVLIDIKEQSATLASYGSRLRYDIRKLKQSGVVIELDYECVHINEFHKIYMEAMHNLAADDYYRFDENYFRRLIRMKRSKVILIFARYKNIRIGAGMFIITNHIMQYYLSGALGAFRRLSPAKLVLEAAHQLAIDWGLQYMVLGGGVGGGRDELFSFKNRFGNKVVPFYLLKKIIDKDAYTQICMGRGTRPEVEGFFPTYRAPFAEDFE